MKFTRAQSRLYGNWVDIVLTVVSIIQGLAFNDLVVRFPTIYEFAIIKNDLQVICCFIFSFVILLRIFQTYVTAALDYENWSVNYFDLILIFIIGAIEYFVFSTLDPKNFDIRSFHIRVSIISVLGLIGYIGAIIRLKKILSSSPLIYKKECKLQLVNIVCLVLVQTISTFIILAPSQTKWVYSISSLISATIISFNIFFSMKSTFSSHLKYQMDNTLPESELSE